MVSPLKLYVHGGAGKTGTSAIQDYLRSNPEKLKANGACYTGLFFENYQPLDDGRPLSTIYASAVAQGPEAMEELVRERLKAVSAHCRENNLHSVIWSNEGILTTHRAMGSVLRSLSRDFDLKLILYFRRQDSWFLSAYKQWGIRHKTYGGSIKDFESWYDGYKIYGDYDKILGEWEKSLAIEQIQVRIYDLCESVVRDFLPLVGLPVGEESASQTRTYRTPSDTVLSLFKLFNNQFEEPRHPQAFSHFLARARILDRSFTDCDLGLGLPDSQRLSQIMDEFRESNRRLARFSTGDYEVRMPEGPTEDSGPGDVTLQQVQAALLFSLFEMDRRLQHALNRISRLEAANSQEKPEEENE